ncbi:DUF6414 family protein [Myxococcus xanthus]|uniref:DUF6414 family protein n=1 Tax=Myxococcus xanthus TaxID=34 RepID=UPI0011271A8C|nr:hypothetical protein [Myxococcus xanthus]
MTTTSLKLSSAQLAIPIYLNQRIIFDLLAIAENGFSQLRTIKTTETGGESNKNEKGAEIGTTNAFSFLGIGVKGAVQNENTTSSQRETSEEKVYTPTALFSKLRDTLIKQELLTQFDHADPVKKAQLGHFIEFRAQLRKNPLLESIETLFQLFDAIKPLGAFNAKQRGDNKLKETELLKQMDVARKLFDSLLQSRTLDLIAQAGSTKAVVPVELEFFERQTPAAIIDGEFRVLGKVVRIVEDGSEHSINLLRSTQLARLPEPMVKEFYGAIDKLRDAGLGIPEITTGVPGPAFQVVPIAIYA